jgi:hypothetical protein
MHYSNEEDSSSKQPNGTSAAGDDDPFYCSSCDWQCQSQTQMQSHLSGSRHKLKLLVAQVLILLAWLDCSCSAG